MHAPLVSIVVPAYNSASFIGDCLDSVFAQDLSNYELIVVDDGSTDGTAAMVRDKCEKKIDYKLLQQPHSGPGRARNRGIEEATGRYLLFLDSDDSLCRQALSVCVSHLNANDLDAVLFEGTVIENNGLSLTNAKYYTGRPAHLHGQVLAGRDIFTESIQLDRYIEAPGMYMTRREVMAAHSFPEGCIYEDSVFTTELLLSRRFRRALCISDKLYQRRSRHGSITSRPLGPENHASLVAVYDRLTELAQSVTAPRVRRCLNQYRSIFLRESISCSTRVNVPFIRRAEVARRILADRELLGRPRLVRRCLFPHMGRRQPPWRAVARPARRSIP